VNRYVILFAREPGREAFAKGFGKPGEELFAAFAAGWLEAARAAGARLVVATPPEDRAAWRGRFPSDADVLWIAQRGGSFGERLEGVARQAAKLPGERVLVGGDVAPAASALTEAFAALEDGAEVVLGPAPDGGVSLVALRDHDLDLLADLAPRQRDVVASLARRLRGRGRVVRFVSQVPDVDGRRGLRLLLRRCRLSPDLTSLARRALSVLPFASREQFGWILLARAVPALRGPPLPA
jgi:uncharacterized protein DUF2064